MKFSLITFTVLTVFLTACGDPHTKAATSDLPATDIIVNSTSELSAPAPIILATFVPNSVASWLGHIIMIDEDGNLHRSTTDSQTHLVEKGNFTSAIGLGRIENPGVFLAVNKKGTLKAFIESDNEGNFKPLPVSIDDSTRLTAFCQNSTPSPNSIWAVNSGGDVTEYNVLITDNASVAIDPMETNVGRAACTPLTYDEDQSISVDVKARYLTIETKGQTKTVSITSGLSIAGISNPAYASATTANMGSVYRDGVVLINEKNSGRIVLIARDYFKDAVQR